MFQKENVSLTEEMPEYKRLSIKDQKQRKFMQTTLLENIIDG